MSGLFSKPRRRDSFPPPGSEVKPEAPVGVPETGEAETTKKRKAIKAGRGGTILTGDLAPQKTGKARLLSGKE